MCVYVRIFLWMEHTLSKKIIKLYVPISYF